MNKINLFIFLKIQKQQLKYISSDLIPQFKIFLNHLIKKEEDNILNKKKKREETKQKNKVEKSKNTNRPIQNSQNMFMTQMPHYKYLTNYSMLIYNPFPYNQVSQIETKNESDNFFYNYMDNKKVTVNHIIGAFYIKKVQQNKPKHLDKKVVPINTVIHENKIVENFQNLNLKNNDLVNLNLINISGNNNCNINIKDSNVNNFEFKEENVIGDVNNFNERKNFTNDLNNNYNNTNEKINFIINVNDEKDKNLFEKSKENKEENINVQNNEIKNNFNIENKLNENEKNENAINENITYRTIIS